MPSEERGVNERRPHVSEAARRAVKEAEGWVWVPRAEVPESVRGSFLAGASYVHQPVRLGLAPDLYSEEDLDPRRDDLYGIRTWEIDWFARARHVFRRSDPWAILAVDFPLAANRPLDELYAIARRLDPRTA